MHACPNCETALSDLRPELCPCCGESLGPPPRRASAPIAPIASMAPSTEAAAPLAIAVDRRVGLFARAWRWLRSLFEPALRRTAREAR